MRVSILLPIVLLVTACCSPQIAVTPIPADVWVLNRTQGYGSACPIYEKGGRTYFATAKHVTQGGAGLKSLVLPGRHILSVRLEWESTTHDLAIVSAPIEGIRHFEIADRTPAFGETLTVVGYPTGKPLTAFLGLALQPHRVGAQVGPGASGGAVLDSRGRLVGIITKMEPMRTYWGDATQWGPVAHYERAALLQRP